MVFLANLTEMAGGLVQQLKVEAGFTAGIMQRSYQRFGRWMAGTARERRQRGIDMIHAGLQCSPLAHRRHARSGMGVQKHRQFEVLLQAADQLGGHRWRQQARHILDSDTVSAHICHGLGLSQEGFHIVHRADRVAQRTLGMLARLLHGFNAGFQITDVVQRIENAEHIDAVFRGLFNKRLHHIVAVVAVPEQVLAAQQHLQAGVGQSLTQGTQALPWVFLQKPHTGIKRGAAPALQ